VQISDSSPASPDLPPRPDFLSDRPLPRSRSLESLDNYHPWRDVPDPDEDDIDDIHFAGGPPRTYHQEWRSPAGNSSFSFSMVSSNGGPIRVTRGGEGQFQDPAMEEVQHDFEDMLGTLLGVQPRQIRRDSGTMPRGTMPLGFSAAPRGQQQPPPGLGGGGIMG
jgi:hypothetical protein